MYESFKSPGPPPNTASPWIALAWLGVGLLVLAWLVTSHPDRVRRFGSILGASEGSETQSAEAAEAAVAGAGAPRAP
jgi:hypothetical protein